jgi:D-alanyl-D-alanine dipeptidase
VDETGAPLPMGSAIDAYPPHCLPSFYAACRDGEESAFHNNRRLLRDAMSSAGFYRLPQEWWHFSYGDRAWAVLKALDDGGTPEAVYGRADLVL